MIALFKIIILSWLIIIQTLLAWDVTGHRLIADIAYQNLTPAAKAQVNQLSLWLSTQSDPRRRFLVLAILPDVKERAQNPELAKLHYINLPFSADGTQTIGALQPNLLTALQQSLAGYENTANSAPARAQALSWLEHFVGDAHQPLHCANRFSQRYPDGDRGGNRVRVYFKRVKNLHQFWDQGAGLFPIKYHRYPLRDKDVRRLAQRIMQRYPQSYFGEKKICDSAPQQWINECFTLAQSVAYNVTGPRLPKDYVARAQQTAEQQIALAGYRLACILNQKE